MQHRDPSATLVGPSPTCVIDEDLPHEGGGDTIEVRSARERCAACIHEPQVDLMDESCRLYREPWRFAAELTACHAPQLVVHKRDEAVERPIVSLAPGQEQAGDVVHVDQPAVTA
jgi:hypothetical protein